MRSTLSLSIAALFLLSARPALLAQAQISTPAAPRASVRFREPEPRDFSNHEGFVSIFDGSTLKDWEGDPEIWHVVNGAITAENKAGERRANSYISYRGTQAHDFDLKLEIKVENGGGSGIQYRSVAGKPWIRGAPQGLTLPRLEWMLTGPQADFWYPVNPKSFDYNGQFYSENTPLGILAWRGQVVEQEPGKTQQLLGNIGDREALGGYVRVNDWNEYEIIARGGVFLHILNGQLMAVYIDDDPHSGNNGTGLIGLELEGTPCKVSARNLWLRKLN